MTNNLESSLEDFLRVQTDIASRQYAEMVNAKSNTSDAEYVPTDIEMFLSLEEDRLVREGKISRKSPQPDTTSITDSVDSLFFSYEDTIHALNGTKKNVTQWKSTKSPSQSSASDVFILALLILCSLAFVLIAIPVLLLVILF
jgi:hypothetical protein